MQVGAVAPAVVALPRAAKLVVAAAPGPVAERLEAQAAPVALGRAVQVALPMGEQGVAGPAAAVLQVAVMRAVAAVLELAAGAAEQGPVELELGVSAAPVATVVAVARGVEV